MPWPQTGATHYHAQLGLPDKVRAIKVLFVCNNWDLEPLDLLTVRTYLLPLTLCGLENDLKRTQIASGEQTNFQKRKYILMFSFD